MVEWNVPVPDDLDSRVRNHVAEHGGGELSDYVRKAVRRQLLSEKIRDIRQRNAGEDPQVIEDEINEALAAIRENRS